MHRRSGDESVFNEREYLDDFHDGDLHFRGFENNCRDLENNFVDFENNFLELAVSAVGFQRPREKVLSMGQGRVEPG